MTRTDTRRLPASRKYGLQEDLIRLFTEHDLDVSVGITHQGVSVRSQDARVDATNLDEVVALSQENS